MCGITGMINFNKSVDTSLFVRMNNIIRHRGPDDEGYILIDSNSIINASGLESHNLIKQRFTNINDVKEEYPIVLGHRRLSILDLTEKGHQPMHDTSGSIYITYNGEIYNFIEIREKLKKKGYTFFTNSDTEVILNSYKEWGEECVNHFNGMWAFAIYDKKKSKIFCSRDRFGVKPFYYYFDNNKLIFSSEVKQIIEDPDIKRIANDKAIYNYIYYSASDYNETTFFKNIYSLPASHNMRIDLNFRKKSFNLKISKYYDISKKEANITESSAIDNFKKHFNESINCRLRSDIEVGSCLSGGLDSSAIVTQACLNLQNKKKTFQTFTACYDENSNIDERYYSKKIVEQCGCKENLIFPNNSNIEKEIKKVIWHQDFPFQSLSVYSQWNVLKGAAQKNVRVLLDGQGADETLLGYERYGIFLLKENIKHFKFITLINNYKFLKLNAEINFHKLILYMIYFCNNKISRYIIGKVRRKFINQDFLKFNKHNDDYIKNVNFKNPFELHKTEIFCSNLGPLLRFEDRDSMAFSIESRVPFLDYKLVESSINTPFNFKISQGWTKSILRNSMKGIMDNEVVFRKNKIGFASPQKEWLNKFSDDFINKYISNMKTIRYFNKKEIIESFKNKTNDEIRWKFLCLEIWFEVFNIIDESNI